MNDQFIIEALNEIKKIENDLSGLQERFSALQGKILEVLADQTNDKMVTKFNK